jgi:hypothetical protein
MSELAEVRGAANREAPKEQSPVKGKLLGKDAILCLERFYGLDDCIEVNLGIVVDGWP